MAADKNEGDSAYHGIWIQYHDERDSGSGCDSGLDCEWYRRIACRRFRLRRNLSLRNGRSFRLAHRQLPSVFRSLATLPLSLTRPSRFRSATHRRVRFSGMVLAPSGTMTCLSFCLQTVSRGQSGGICVVEDSQNDWFRSTQRASDGSSSAEVDGRASKCNIDPEQQWRRH